MDLQEHRWAIVVPQAILARQAQCTLYHVLQERPALRQDYRRQMPLAQLVTIAEEGQLLPRQLTTVSTVMEATAAGLASTAQQALAGLLLAVLGRTTPTISLIAHRLAFHAEQEHTVAPQVSLRRLRSVQLAMFAQLVRQQEHQVHDHQLVFALLVQPVPVVQQLLSPVLLGRTSLFEVRPIASLVQQDIDAAQLTEES